MRSPYLRGYVADPAHGPLLGLLLVLTLTTGMVDAVTILRLGKVFTANMTGNTVFIGLAAVRAPGFSLGPLLVALLFFAAGVIVGGTIARRSPDRARLLRRTTTSQAVLVLATVVVAVVAGEPIGGAARIAALALLATSFGVQNAAVNVLKVPDETAAVVTRTITALIVDARQGPRPVTLRRLLSVLCILGGAVVGGVLVLHTNVALTLSLVLLLQLAVIGLSTAAARRPAPWQAMAAA